MADHQERLGQSVGDYRLLQWLGGGSFGNVYLAEHQHNQTQVAIKILEMRLTNADDLRAFLNEARMFRLQHPHIMPLHDFGLSKQDEPFLVMDYAPKGTLRDRHPRGSRVPLLTIVDYVTQIGSALQYAHDQRLIHRDVKPENMLLRSDDALLLSDFGVATVAHSTHSITVNAGVSGTMLYMAPEQLEGKPHPASDQYALAVVAYEWLTGSCPFVGTTVEVAVQHATRPPPSLLVQVSDISSEVEEVLFHALAKDPRARFASMRAFTNALQQSSVQPSQPLPIFREVSPPLFPTTPSGANYPPLLTQPTPPLGMQSLPLSQPTPGGEVVPPPLNQPTPGGEVVSPPLNQTVPAGGPYPATFLANTVPAFGSPSGPDLGQISAGNRIVPPQPNRRRRILIASLVGGLMTVLAGSGALALSAEIFNPTCSSGQTKCNGNCVNLKNNSSNCGNCGHICTADKTCLNGTCQCLPNQTQCGGTCADLKTNSRNCGSCGHICTADKGCVGGICQCISGKTDCNGTCLNLKSDSSNCGSCGNACTGGKSCVNGICQCPAGQNDCNGTCLNLKKDTNNCGSCGNVCPSGTTCVNGACCTGCGGACVDLTSDPGNCGGCGNACGGGRSCLGGICCANGLANCGGYCVNTGNNSSNCGSCGHVCPANASCVGGTCKCNYASCGSGCCPSGTSCCGGGCVDTGSDFYNCGGCGNVCPSYSTCVNGTCVCSYQSCGSGCCQSGLSCCYSSCVDINSDNNNCGSCGYACNSGYAYCSGGSCTCDGATCSNGSCCQSGYDICCYNQCFSSASYTCCGSYVCYAGDTCCNGGCCPSSSPVCSNGLCYT